jgi:rubrerythrin
MAQRSSTKSSGSEGGEELEAKATEAETGDEFEVEEVEEEEEDVEPDVETLFGLAQMDAEAALAYETTAELIDDERVAETLRAFAGDHRRHVDDIGRLLSERGEQLETATPDPEASTFVSLAAAVAPLGLSAALRAMIGNEQFTNSVYSTAVEVISDPEALALLERNYADEQRHLNWLTRELESNREAGEEAAGPSADV